MNSFITVISGTSGAGKTTLCRKLESIFANHSIYLSFDDYFAESDINFVEWYNRGANPEEIENQQLHEDLVALRDGKDIKHIRTGERLQPAKYIFLDEPFGKGRYKTNSLIDYSIHLEIPLEISLARRILRHLSNPDETADKQNQSIKSYLNSYLDNGLSDLYRAADRIALAECDVSLNGTKSTEELVFEVLPLLPKMN